MRSFLFVLIFIVFTKQALATPEGEKAFATFETYCLANITQPQRIDTMLSAVGIKPLPTEIAKAILMPQKGKAWLVAKGISIALTEEGTCTVSAPYVSGEETKGIFKKYIKNIKITSETMGSQLQDIYAITYPDLSTGDLSRTIVMITTTNMKSIDGIIFNALPEKLALKNNLKIKNWPK